VGSGEVKNWPFLEDISSRGKPIILSTGMYELADVLAAIEVIRLNGAPPLAILHCITAYPASPATVNLHAMDQIREIFPGPVGYSDHTVGTAVALASVALGADIVEKHITLEKNIPNAQDWKVACDRSELISFIQDVRAVENSIRGSSKELQLTERKSIEWARKSICAAYDIDLGQLIHRDMLTALRPGRGIPPSETDKIVGRRAKVPISKGEYISFEKIA